MRPSPLQLLSPASRWTRAAAWLFALALSIGCGTSEEVERDATTGTASEDSVAHRADATPTSASGPLFVFLGDSITAGLHLDAEQAFPSVLRERLAADGHAIRIVNAGVSGDTTAGGLRRIDWLLRQDPDWVVVELGGNDGLRGVAIESIERNLRAILERVRDSGAGAILFGVRMPPNYGEPYTSDFAAIFGRLAREFDVPFVPFFLEGVGGVPEMNLEDGLHPTPAGHRRIVETVLPVFLDVLSGDGDDRDGDDRDGDDRDGDDRDGAAPSGEQEQSSIDQAPIDQAPGDEAPHGASASRSSESEDSE